MTGRERVLCALAHREPDRVPIDLGGTESSGMTAVAYLNLCDCLGIRDTPRIFDPSQQIALINEPVRRRFSIDTALLAFEPAGWAADTTSDGRPALSPAGWRPEGGQDGSRVVKDAKGRIVARMPAGGFYYDSTYQPLSGISSPAQVPQYSKSFEEFDKAAIFDEGWDAMAVRARELHTKTGDCVVANLCVHVLAAGQMLRGFENFMMDLAADEAMAAAVMENLLEAYLPRVDAFAEKMARWVDVVLVNDDLGTQGGPMLSPKLYRRMVKPYHARLYAHVKKRFGKPLLLHSCGSIYRLLPDIIEIGVDAINPVQVSAAEMDSAKLKKEFGRDLTFWGGGCDTQAVLGAGTPDDVRQEVTRRIDDLAPGGGFVFTQVHNIQPNVPPRNVAAMLETALEYGAY
jgi:uroporphyrinogen decarboxylase